MRKMQGINLKNLLVLRYHLKENEARSLTEFLMPMLEWYPERRASFLSLLSIEIVDNSSLYNPNVEFTINNGTVNVTYNEEDK